MRIAFLAGYFDAWGTYLASLRSLESHTVDLHRVDESSLETDFLEVADLIVYCGINGGEAKPSDEDLKKLRDIAPTVMICPEASDRTWWWKLCADYQAQETFDLIVNIDGNRDWPGAGKGLTLLMPVDFGPWGEPIKWENRYVECGFSGGNSNPYRGSMLSELKDIVTWRGPDPDVDAAKTYNGYRDFMKQTKVAFNMCQHGTVPHYDRHARHVKGRVLEAALAGCALVEGAGPTSDWFVPESDYLVYEDAREARIAIDILRKDPQMARGMADRLRAKVLRDHSPEKFWGQVFDRVGMKAEA